MQESELEKRFKSRQLVIATKHNKEKVIAPLLEHTFAIDCIVAPNLDTDLLGTFTGEIERSDEPLETARKKCHLAMDLTKTEIAVASEGSFGPHPGIGFVHADDELLLFIDKKNNLEIWARELSLNTNFNAQEIHSLQQLIEFSENAKFPSHGLILRKSESDTCSITKGITDWETLQRTFMDLHNKYGKAYVETDMRAMYNPTRMRVIEDATKKLVAKISSCCPSCQTPGFGITDAKPGLPCEQCGFPTRSTLSHEYKCKACDYADIKIFPNGKEQEEPIYCDICNP